jgi:hypothetical protein
MSEKTGDLIKNGTSIIGVPCRILATALIAASLSACQLALPDIGNPFDGSTPTSTSERDPDSGPQNAANKEGETETPRFTQFTDIPIPANAEVDLDNLLVLGTEDGWIGRLEQFSFNPGHTLLRRSSFRIGLA